MLLLQNPAIGKWTGMLSLRNPNARVLTKFMKITGFFQKLGSKCVILMKIAWGLKMCDSKADCIRLDRFSSNSTGLILMVYLVLCQCNVG